jgi:hypothetical protein
MDAVVILHALPHHIDLPQILKTTATRSCSRKYAASAELSGVEPGWRAGGSINA